MSGDRTEGSLVNCRRLLCAGCGVIRDVVKFSSEYTGGRAWLACGHTRSGQTLPPKSGCEIAPLTGKELKVFTGHDDYETEPSEVVADVTDEEETVEELTA
jgi:hypothetical protein